MEAESHPKDYCRKGLTKYLDQALDFVYLEGELNMLDIGCGSGIPTLVLAGRFNGKLLAVDPNADALLRLRKRAGHAHIKANISCLQGTLENLASADHSFHLILAEGLLNVTGFEYDFSKLDLLLREGGFMVVHDEASQFESKMAFAANKGYRLVFSNMLDEKIWWDDFYSCLEQQLAAWDEADKASRYANEYAEIDMIKQQPAKFRSVYYVLRKGKAAESANTINF